MSVEIVYRCNGCESEAHVRGLKRTWDVVRHGRVMDLCAVKTPTIESAAPEGWMGFDPYTGVTYCPACWGEIESCESSKTEEMVP